MVQWEKKISEPIVNIDYFLLFVVNVNGGDRKYKIMSSGKRYFKFKGLKTFADYSVTFIAVDMQGMPCRSAGFIQRTDESGEFLRLKRCLEDLPVILREKRKQS